MTKIEALTDEQTARLTEYRDKWLAIGLSTAPANRERAEGAINTAYLSAGLKPPGRIVWCGSPLSQGLTRAIVPKMMNDRSVRDSVRARVWDSVRASVWASVGASVRDSVRDSVSDSVTASVGASVRASVGASVWASVRGSVWGSCYGQHDAPWLGFYEYFRDVVGLTAETEPLAGLIEQAKHAGWFIPHKDICWVAERHNILRRDGQGRLHCDDSPALAYPDGWAIYVIHGVRVPAVVVEAPSSMTVEQINKEPNVEVRRVMIERFGQERYLMESRAKLIHTDEWGKLYRTELSDDEPLVMVKVVNATAEVDGGYKDYFIRVPPSCKTAHEAVAWTFDETPETYREFTAQT